MGEEIKLKHLPDGTPYVRLYLGRDKDGKPIRPYRQFDGMSDAAATKAAEAWAEELRAKAGGPTVGELLADYIEHMEADGHSANTVRTYNLLVARYVAPIAAMHPAEVTTADLDELFKGLLTDGPNGAGGLSTTTVQLVRHFLRGAWKRFAAAGIVENNVVAGTMPIQTAGTEARVLDETEAARLLEAIKPKIEDEDADMPAASAATAIYIAMNTGMRVGEIAALRRRDVSLIRREITVCGNVVETGGQCVRQGKTKGKKTRIVALNDQTAEAIRRQMRRQDKQLQRVTRDTPICTTDGTHMAPTALSSAFKRYKQELDLDPALTFHSLRHTHATMLLQSGIDARVVQERLGHADVSTTLKVYGHVMPGRDRQAAETIGRIYGEGA